MGMGGCDVELSSSKSTRRPAGLQIVKSEGCIKPRIIHTYSPKIYKIRPEEFLDLVQKLTGRPPPEEKSTFQFFGNESKSEMVASEENSSRSSESAEYEREFQISKPTSEALGTPVSNQLLASLTKPRFVTLNFLPMFSSSPRSNFSQSRREESFTFPSAAC